MPVVRVDTLGDQAYAQVRDALASGSISPGEQLTVRGLVQALNIGFTPAREALNRLAAESVLMQGPNRTLRVPSLTRAKYEELVAIRSELEPLAACEALPYLGGAHLKSLERIQRRLLAAMKRRDYPQVLGFNREFHFTIYRAAPMPTLVGMIEGLWLQIGPTLRLLYPGYASNWKGGANHAEILDSIRSSDARRLARAIRKDLDDGRVPIAAALSAQTHAMEGLDST